MGKAYIESRLEETEGHLELLDLMELGTRREESGDRDGAIEAYKEARKKAAALYDADIKAEALEKQAALEAQIVGKYLPDCAKAVKWSDCGGMSGRV